MTEDGDDPVSAVALATVAATTAYTLSRGTPSMPDVKPPPPPPPPPAAPPPPPPAPPETEALAGIGTEKRKRATRYGVSDTLLTNPLGGTSTGARPPGSSLLGG